MICWTGAISQSSLILTKENSIDPGTSPVVVELVMLLLLADIILCLSASLSRASLSRISLEGFFHEKCPKRTTFLPPQPVLLRHVPVVPVHVEHLRVEEPLVAGVAEEHLVPLVESPRGQLHAALVALDAPAMVGLAVRGHDLEVNLQWEKRAYYIGLLN